jgi:hypothetical protein
MPKTFDLYCAPAEDLDEARALVEKAIGTELKAHESMYWGGTYYLAKATAFGDVAVRSNFNAFTRALNKRDFPDCRFVVYVDVPPDPDVAKQKLVAGGLLFLQRKVV